MAKAVISGENPERSKVTNFQRIQHSLVHLHAPRRLANGASLYKRDDGRRAKDIIRALRDSVLYEVDVCNQIWVRHLKHLRPQNALRLSKLEMGPLNIILGCFGLLPL
ncbi:unnamed protein product [Hymenolepis diminuta]|uniref:Uncharacterized protein n=1 Tax=Hymenolepis diminuta TaxID=6216 RepID=A0A564Z151_HYMDI|nr:unnamed protein product [Hymenolepis diminuta]